MSTLVAPENCLRKLSQKVLSLMECWSSLVRSLDWHWPCYSYDVWKLIYLENNKVPTINSKLTFSFSFSGFVSSLWIHNLAKEQRYVVEKAFVLLVYWRTIHSFKSCKSRIKTETNVLGRFRTSWISLVQFFFYENETESGHFSLMKKKNGLSTIYSPGHDLLNHTFFKTSKTCKMVPWWNSNSLRWNSRHSRCSTLGTVFINFKLDFL